MPTNEKPDYQGNMMESDGDVVLLVKRIRGADPVVNLLRWPRSRRTAKDPPLIWSGSIADLARIVQEWCERE